MTMDFKSGYIAILMVYVTFGGFTRNLVHGGNESTSTEGISNFTSTKLGIVQVNISNTTMSYLGTSVSSDASSSLGTSVSSDASSSLGTSVSNTTSSSLGTSVSSTTSSSLGTSVSSDASSSLGTSVSSTTSVSLGTSVSNTTMSSLGTSVSSDASSSLGASVSSDASSSLGTSVSSTTMSSLGTSISSDASSSLGTSVSSDASSSLGKSVSSTTSSSLWTTVSSTTSSFLGTTISSTTSSSLVTSVSSTPLSALGTSISSTTLSDIKTSISMTTKLLSTTTTSGQVLSDTAPGNISSTKMSALMSLVSSTTLKSSGTSISSTTLSTIGTSTFLAANTSTTVSGADQVTESSTAPWIGCQGILCNISVCDNYYCHNGGKCRNDSGNAVCDCLRDTTGRHCEHNGNFSCHEMPSSARDHIISCIDNIGYYTLVCKPEWTGENCETPINIINFCNSIECNIQTMEYCNAVCERGNCWQNYIMSTDEDMYSGDTETSTTEGCKFTIGNPWNMCNTPNCIERFANGLCDAPCNNEDCLYDGYDCIDGKGFLDDCSPYFNTPCSSNLTFNEKCNPECNTTDCLYDGFDCASSGLTQLPGQLVIQVIQVQPNSHMDSIVRKIGLLLRSGINNNYMPKNDLIAYLQLTCSELVNKKCFTSIQSVAKFLAAYVAKLTVPDLFVTDIFACEDGYYGYQGCKNKCSDGCKNSTNREICHKYSGECLDGCRDEYYGIMCNTKCNDNCGESVGRRCNMSSGVCLYSCKKNYYGGNCEQVCSKKCIDSCHQNGTCIGGCQGNLSYGFHCEKNCPELCQNSTCDHLGKCHACVIGYHGDNCTETCPKECIEGCSKTTGDCFKGKTHHHGNKCEADASYGQNTERDPEKTDYTGVIVGVVVSVFIIAAAILIAFLCWRRQQSGDYILGEDADTKTNANLEAVTTVQDQHSHMANFASSKDAVDLDDMHDNSVYVGRPKSTDDDKLTENLPETTHRINNQFQPFVEIAFTADVDDSNEFLNSGRLDWKQSPQDYAAETRDTDDQSSDDNEDVAVQTSGLLAAGGAPLAASEASLLSKDTLGEAPESDNEPPQPDNEFMYEDGNLPQVTEADFNEENNSDEEEEEQETQRLRSSSSSSSSSSDNN